MAVAPAVADALTSRMPKVLSSRHHEIADYATIAIFLAAAGVFWKRNRRASMAALICAGAELGLDVLTDYSGTGGKVVSFPTHGKMDLGLAAFTATMPELLGFREDRAFFLAQAAMMTGKVNLTSFSRAGRSRNRRSLGYTLLESLLFS